MTRDGAIRRALDHFDGGAFLDALARRVAIPTESQNPARAGELERYLREEIGPAVERLGGRWEIYANPEGAGPFLVGSRIEDPALMRFRQKTLGAFPGNLVDCVDK